MPFGGQLWAHVKSILSGLEITICLSTSSPPFPFILALMCLRYVKPTKRRSSDSVLTNAPWGLQWQECGLLGRAAERSLKHFHFAMETALMWHVVKGLGTLAGDLWCVDTPSRQCKIPFSLQTLLPSKPYQHPWAPTLGTSRLLPSGVSSSSLLGFPRTVSQSVDPASQVVDAGFRRRVLEFSGKLTEGTKQDLLLARIKYFTSCFHKRFQRVSSKCESWFFFFF